MNDDRLTRQILIWDAAKFGKGWYANFVKVCQTIGE